MHERPPADNDALLEGLLSGSIDPTAPDVRARLDADPELAETFEELQQFALEMAELGVEQREVMDGAAALEAAPGQERVDAEIAAFFEERRASPSRRSRWIPFLAAAAAVLLVLLPFLGGAFDSEDPALVMLGDSERTSLSPSGAVSDFGAFAWDTPLPADSTFKVLVFGEDQEPWDIPFFESERLDEPSLELTPEVERTLPDRIRWELRIYDATGGHTSPASAVAWRSRP